MMLHGENSTQVPEVYLAPPGRLSGHEFEETLGEGEGQESLVCCSPWGRKESDTTERLINNYSL